MEQHQFGLREWADLCERKDATIAALTQENERLKQGQAIDLKNNNDYREQVAALQARVQELEDGCEMMTHTAGTFQELWRTACDQREAFEQQLTQRTAECDALKLVNDTHMKTVMKLSHVVEQRTAELEAARTALNALRDGYDDLESRHSDAQAELERVRDQFADLRKMVAALPKVEGEITANRVCTIMMRGLYCEEFTKLLQHRQGMEG